MPRARVYETNAERQAAYRARRREEEAARVAVRAQERRWLSDALIRLESQISFAARCGVPLARELAELDSRAAQLNRLAQWFHSQAEAL